MPRDGELLELDIANAERIAIAITLPLSLENEEFLITRRIAKAALAAAHRNSGRPDLARIYWNQAQQLHL